MDLPDGVRHQPGRERLISMRDGGLITIDDRADPALAGYAIKDRDFAAAVQPYLHGDWALYDAECALRREGVAYSGADYAGIPARPSITVLPDLLAGTAGDQAAHGCTMGHWHPRTLAEAAGEWTQEVYEFQTHGLMALDRQAGTVELHVCAPGDKVAVPNACHMTLYNLGGDAEPLVTLDFASPIPGRNPANKDLIAQVGPAMLITRDAYDVTIQVNALYADSPSHAAGVRLGAPARRALDRSVRIELDDRVPLGVFLHAALLRDNALRASLGRIGLVVAAGSPAIEVTPYPGTLAAARGPIRLCGPLASEARPGSALYDAFAGDGAVLAPGA